MIEAFFHQYRQTWWSIRQVSLELGLSPRTVRREVYRLRDLGKLDTKEGPTTAQGVTTLLYRWKEAT